MDTGFLEVDYGLTQLVTGPTHERSILDKVFVSRPDIYTATVFSSLLKIKHKALLIQPINDGFQTSTPYKNRRRKTVTVYDLRQSNIDKLRFYLGTYDWSSFVACNSVATIYTWFLYVVREIISFCVPTKNIKVGPRDPDFVTPLVKSLLIKRRKLRIHGRSEAADKLAEKNNGIIVEYRKERLVHLERASPKQLWSAVRGHSNRGVYTDHRLCDPNAVNHFLKVICSSLSGGY